ncbi:MAG: serine hydrolase, partial [Defluviitaleaceae bacterium]|nr:serine hydrolase [Defluviitaleaceae bacterium]
MFKKTLSLILAVTMIFSITAVSSATPVFAQEGEAAAFLPLRMIFETEGAEVSWNDEGGFITVVYEGDIYNFSPGSNIAQFNNLEFELNYEIVMDEGRAFIAYDDIAFLFGEEYSLTKQTAVIMTHQFLEGLGIPGMTVALVDADLGYTWTFGAGFADIEAGRFVNEMTLFDIGSVTKTFTAYAVLQLVEQGIIDLDEPIVTYLPDFSVLPHPVYGGDYRNITARMLLAHISGVPGDTFDGLFVTGGQSPDYMNNFLA